MEIRKLYKQGKSLVLVIPSVYLKALGWTENDHLSITLLPLSCLRLTKLDSAQPSLFPTNQPITTTHEDNHDTD